MDIATKIREEAGKPSWAIPGPDPARPWVRFDCPFCTGKTRNTAAVNHAAGRAECFRCEKVVRVQGTTYPENDREFKQVLDDYRPQVDRQVQAVKARFRVWVTLDDLNSRALELVWGYLYRAPGGPNDAGRWFDWEADANGDPEFIRSRLGQALYGDLMNYARNQVSWKRNSGLTMVPVGEKVRVDYYSNASELPVVQRSRWTDELVAYAEMDRVSFTSWGARGCELIRNGVGPVKGHCDHCRAVLRSSLSTCYQESSRNLSGRWHPLGAYV